MAEIERLLEHDTAGDPMTGLRWMRKTTAKVATQLRRIGIQVGARTVARLLRKLRFSLRVNQKKLGARHPDRDRQFRYIATLRQRFRRQGNPIISVDAKKREMVGPFKNAGAKWDRVPTPVNDHDFPSLAKGIAVLYGIYDLHANRRSMFVGVSHETSAFAVTSIRKWWGEEGRKRYPNAQRLLILADTGAATRPHAVPGRITSNSSFAINAGSRLRSPTIRPAHRNITPSSDVCSVRSATTGKASRW